MKHTHPDQLDEEVIEPERDAGGFQQLELPPELQWKIKPTEEEQ